MGVAYIRKVKRGKGDGLWGSHVVEEDHFGIWLYTPPHSLYRGTNETDVAYCYAGWPDPPGAPVIHLIPPSEWWFARWQQTPSGAHLAIDICTLARLNGDVWSYDDLELDLLKYTNGRIVVVDEADFAAARRDGHISEDEAEISLRTLARLNGRLRSGDELFDSRGWQQLARFNAQAFEPLVTLPD